MDDGEIELSDQNLLSNPSSFRNIQGSASVDSLLDEFLKNTTTCTHTHTCNPRGPDAAAHTHTCYHTHTLVFSSEEDGLQHGKSRIVRKPKRPSGNREAVRKYREKKKAHAAHLEDEVKKLRLLNQQLVRKVQGQAILEAEVLRLRSLLLDIRGKIDDELGAFPFQKLCNSSINFKEGECGIESVSGAIGMQCETDIPCFHPQVRQSLPSSNHGGIEGEVFSSEGNCQFAVLDGQVNANGMVNTAERSGAVAETLVSSTAVGE
ncbi:hypothetical protein Ancab_034339 [Ancistrocladus abbreviatus]